MASKKRKAASLSASPDVVVDKVLSVLKAHDIHGGLRQVALEAALTAEGVKLIGQELLNVLNPLLTRGKIVVCQAIDKSVMFRLQSDEDAAKLRDLTAEDRLVYQEIETSSTKGASTKDLRAKTGMVAQALTKALKKLETRKLVRQVKSVAAKNTKIYMLINLEPGREITGGTWYSDEQEFDHELITCLRDTAVKMIMRDHQATVSQVHEFIQNSGLVKGKQLEVSDIEEILETLVSDARLECDTQLSGQQGSAVVYEKLYRMRPAFSFVDEEIRAYTSVPDCECLTCASKWRDGSTYQQYVPCPAMSVWLAHACDRNAHL